MVSFLTGTVLFLTQLASSIFCPSTNVNKMKFLQLKQTLNLKFLLLWRFRSCYVMCNCLNKNFYIYFLKCFLSSKKYIPLLSKSTQISIHMYTHVFINFFTIFIPHNYSLFERAHKASSHVYLVVYNFDFLLLIQYMKLDKKKASIHRLRQREASLMVE